MALFADADEVYRHLGRLFVDLAADEDYTVKLRAADTIVQYVYTDPAAVITVKMLTDQSSQVDLGPTDLVPEVTLTMSADVGHRFWLGEVNVTVALARGQMRATGPVAKVLKLVPLTKPVFPRYREMLAEQGRPDLAGTPPAHAV